MVTPLHPQPPTRPKLSASLGEKALTHFPHQLRHNLLLAANDAGQLTAAGSKREEGEAPVRTQP